MPLISPEQQASEWRQLLARFPKELIGQLAALAAEHQVELATHFYTQMLADSAASHYLSHEQVKTRLSGSLQRWLVMLFSASLNDELAPLIALQRQVGDIHARIDVPVHLVLRGARCLKERLFELIIEQGWSSDTTAQALVLVTFLLDQAMEIMSRAYANSHDRNARTEEAYRLFSVVQDIGVEKERQRAALLDWENQLMFDLAMAVEPARLPRLSASEFGLWFRHKGAYAFKGAPESEQVLRSMEHIDEVLLPLFVVPVDPAQRQRELRELREQTKSLVFHLDTLFVQINELESGRDVLTRMLNRKFLPVVLGKEIAYAREHKRSFAVLAVDIDHFKHINDTFGHESGDLVLQQVATLLSNQSRGGDYVFRLGGEEFLVLLVDINQSAALIAAEKLRQVVEQEVFRLPHDKSYRLTVSIGVTLHDGHPDYQQMLRRADQALYDAKHGGRNQVVLLQAQPAAAKD
ncbi:diguanylate cyclase [Pseudomonas sp. Marseille-Q8238]